MTDVTLKNGAAVKAIPTSQALIEDPLLNKGSAFTQAERDAFKLNGYFADAVETLDTQVARSIETIRALMRKGHSVRFADGPYGGYQAIMVNPDGGYVGASESRKDGMAAGY